MENNNVDYTGMMQPVPPGVSWTAPEKGRPWQNPPKVVDINDLAMLYIQQLSSPDAADSILTALESRAPIASIAQTFMLHGVSEGVHSMDAGMLVMPVIMEMLATLAIVNNIRTVMYPDDITKMTTISPRVAAMAVKKAMQPLQEQPVKQEVKTGLMSKKQKEVV
jgi:hypothetical protein